MLNRGNLQNKGVIEQYRFLFLFIVMICFFLVKSLSAQIGRYEIATAFFLVLIVYSLYVIGNKSKKLILSLLITGIAEAIFVLFSDALDSLTLLAGKSFFAIIFFSLMTYACMLFTLADKKITVTTLFGSLCTYLFLGLSFAYSYLLLMVFNQESFKGVVLNTDYTDIEFIYYSFVTLTTLGFGDVVPMDNVAKTISWMEAYFGQAYLTIMMAFLVGRYLQTDKE